MNLLAHVTQVPVIQINNLLAFKLLHYGEESGAHKARKSSQQLHA